MSRRDYTKWKEIKNVLIRDLTDEDNDTIRAIMNDTGCFLASKALMRCVYSFLRMSATTKSLIASIQDLQQENHCLRSNAALLAEVVKKRLGVIKSTRSKIRIGKRVIIDNKNNNMDRLKAEKSYEIANDNSETIREQLASMGCGVQSHSLRDIGLTIK